MEPSPASRFGAGAIGNDSIVTRCNYAHLASLKVERTPKGISHTRRFVQSSLTSNGVDDDTVDTAVLLTNELVTNALMHTDGAIEVVLGAGAGVLVEVRDTNPAQPFRPQSAFEATTGRGLALIEMMANAYGVLALQQDGKSVWFMLGDEPKQSCRRGWGSDNPGEGASTLVQLRNLSIPLFKVMTEHNDALLREFALSCLDVEQPVTVDAYEASLSDRFRSRFSRAIDDRLNESANGSKQLGTNIDLELTVTAADRDHLFRVRELIHRAETLARNDGLLVRPALPEVGAFRHWVLGQVIDQYDGAVPQAWRYNDLSTDLGASSTANFDVSWTANETRSVVVADDANHIIAISPPVTQALGWSADDLVGQRIVTIIPPRFREAHVAGFTRQVVTGEPHILGQKVNLAALHKDGHEITIPVMLERRSAGPGTVFLAWIG